MDTKDPNPLLAILLKLVSKHERAVVIVESLALVATDHARMLERSLPRCAGVSCPDAATVKHLPSNVKCCDLCAARLVVHAQQGGPALDAVMGESSWFDLPDAVQVRRMQDYLAVMKRGEEEPDVPEDNQLLH
jgi:hypothetical protein